MVNLSVLGKLQLGERLRCRHGRFFQLYHRRDGRFTLTVPETLLRWWDGSSRHSDFRAVLDVYNAGMVEIAHLRREEGEVAKATERQLLQRSPWAGRPADRLLHVELAGVELVEARAQVERFLRQLHLIRRRRHLIALVQLVQAHRDMTLHAMWIQVEISFAAAEPARVRG